MSREELEARLKLHPLQYGITSQGDIIYNTENGPERPVVRGLAENIERYNRCPNCEQWSPCDKRKELLAQLQQVGMAQPPATREQEEAK